MCYSAQIHSDYRKMVREVGAIMDLEAFARLWIRENGLEQRKIPKAVIDTLQPLLPPAAAQVMDDRRRLAEQDWQQELFKQSKRKADNERKLAVKHTKTAEIELGRATRKVEQLKGWISNLHRTELEAPDWRFFPQWWVPVLVREGDGYVFRPMRYQLRKPGLPASSDYTKDGKLSGTYNARRDNLGRYWRHQFGHTHGLMVVDAFWENVELPNGRTKRLKFRPRTGEVFRRVQAFARERGALGAREAGSVPPYLWAAMEIAYQCRLRGIEVITLTDAHDLGATLRTNRRKGSRDNQVRKGDLLTAALDHLRAYRETVWTRRRTPIPMQPGARPIFVGEDGAMLTRRAWDSGWGRVIRMAIAEGVIEPGQRFGLHGLKHRGATDTVGTYEVKKQATGHKTDAMVHLYDHDVPTVEPSNGG